jgi:hypothetical protein
MPEGQDLSNNLEANSIEAIQDDPEPKIEKNVPENEPCDTNTAEPPLSKRAMKRKLKHEKWLKWKPIKR